MLPQLEPRSHGYIARRYTYFNSDPYFSQLGSDKSGIAQSLLGLWVTFLFLNLLIPILSITRGKQVLKWLSKATAVSNPRLYRAIVFTIILFNIIYILSAMIFHFQAYPTATKYYISTSRELCTVPSTSTSYNYILGILITKAIILPVALLTELAVVICRVIKDLDSPPWIKQCTQIVVIWQLLVFVHITAGHISVPFLVLVFISPATVLLTSAGMLLLIIFNFTVFPIPKQCNFKLLLQSCLLTAETLLIVALYALHSSLTTRLLRIWTQYEWDQRLYHDPDSYHHHIYFHMDAQKRISWKTAQFETKENKEMSSEEWRKPFH